MKRLTILILLLFPMFSAANDMNDTFDSSLQLSKWCELNSKYYLSQNGTEVYNFSASPSGKENFLIIKGNWKTAGGSINVYCAAEKRARRRFALLSIEGEEVEVYPQGYYPGIDGRISLAEWCKSSSAKEFLRQEQYPYNWSFIVEKVEMTLVVKGKWRVDFETRELTCRMQKGEIVIEMQDED